ncbi:MAG: shikimate dehydrogenase family protein [Candidatus Xenobium sp.]|nr:shikimate dehydrogenase [Burkholderiales bacterium]
MISPETRTAWILGSPLGHTLSPLLHNAAYRALGLDLVYLPARVESRDLRAALEGLSILGAVGCNLTLPLKEVALGLMTRIEPPAAELGAINTVRFEGGDRVGFNTDAWGWLRSWDEEVGQSLEGRPVLLLGAGGAARAVAWALASRRVARIQVVNRDPERARRLVASLARTDVPCRLGSVELETDMVVVQATSVGMVPGDEATCMEWPEEVPPGVVACDLVYRPRQTRFLREASQRGVPTLGGVGMLVHQAVAAIEVFTGENPCPVWLRRVAEEALSSDRCTAPGVDPGCADGC